MTQQRGFTLIELMIVVAIIALISAFAYPSYVQYVQRSARAAVKAELMADTGTMERLRAQTFSYNNAKIDTTNSTLYKYSPSGSTAADAKYVISFVVGTTAKTTNTDVSATVDTNSTYVLMAVSTNKFDSNKSEALAVNQAGQRCYKGLSSGVTSCTIGTDSPVWP